MKDYSGTYQGVAHYVSNKRCYGCPVENIDTTYTNVQVLIVKGQEKDSWTMTIDTEDPFFYKNRKVSDGSFSYFDGTSAGTEVIDIKGRFTKDSLKIVHKFTVHSGGWNTTKSIRVLKKS